MIQVVMEKASQTLFLPLQLCSDNIDKTVKQTKVTSHSNIYFMSMQSWMSPENAETILLSSKC